jgi:hypothetical protein
MGQVRQELKASKARVVGGMAAAEGARESFSVFAEEARDKAEQTIKRLQCEADAAKLSQVRARFELKAEVAT